MTKARELEGLLARVSVMHGQVQVQVGASVGAALLRADITPAEIITAADRAMYGRKQEKRGRACGRFSAQCELAEIPTR